ncbi:glycosyltransferase family 39 protein [Rhizobium calliandrae]|uniref:Glycosyltransferase family 39 protein n=1 Tax=Rhizobium calliandrae TaxID=1312182 RepID=A0ABT7KMH0_9HYPH|nr:glycosyltransferase family 39 protein [Rhizobium calliandrae]MDL2409190.1 glycosyltransferase family 39 protein [Rhizobium calliandrae]
MHARQIAFLAAESNSNQQTSPGVETPAPMDNARRAEAEVQSINPWKVAILLLAALTLYRFAILAQIGLHPDEAYYWLWSRVPQAGYYDHAPMIAWWIWLSTQLLGDNSLGVRLFPILSVLIVSGATIAISWELYRDSRLAVRAGVWANAMPLIGFAVLLATPDAPSILFWTLAVWALVWLRRSGDRRIWLLVGLLAGLGCLSKYTNLFLGLGILLWMILDSEARKRLYGPHMFIGGAIALAIFSPTIFWNFEHHWVSFAKQFGRIDNGQPLSWHTLEFLAGQFGLANPAIAIFAAIAVATAWKQRGAGEVSPTAFLLVLSAPMLIYMLLHSFHSRVQGNWLAPVYPTMAIMAAEAARHSAGSRHLRRMTRWAAPAGIGLIVASFYYFASPLGQQAPFPSPADKLIGWNELSTDIAHYKQLHDAGWIGTIDYGMTGELAFNADDAQHVQEIISRKRYSFETVDPKLVEQPGLLVIPVAGGMLERLRSCLPQMVPVGEVARRAGKRVLERYAIFTIKHAPRDIFITGCI